MASNERTTSDSDVVLYFVAVFLPPVPVYLKAGFGVDFLINVLLCLFTWFPAVIHAWYILSRREDGSFGGFRYHQAPATTTADSAHGYSEIPAPATAAPATTAPGTTGYGATPETTGAMGVSAKRVD